MLSALFTYLPSIVGSTILAVFVLTASNRSKTRTFFIAFASSMAVWQTTLLLTYIDVPASLMIWFERLAILSGTFVGVSFLLFCLAFPANNKISSKIIYLLLAITSVLLFMIFLPLTIKNVGNSLVYGPGYTISFVFAVIYILISIVSLIKKRKINLKSQGQINLILAGIIVVAIVNILTNYIFVNLNLGVIGAIAVLFFEATLVLAISTKGLFNFRAFVTRMVAYSASIGLILVVYSILSAFIVKSLVDVNIKTSTLVLLTFFSAITALLFQPIKKFFDRVTNRIFYRDAYNPQDLLNKVNSALVGEIDLHKLLNNSAEVIKTNLKAEYCNYYIDEKATIDFHVAGTNTKLFVEPKWINLMELVEKDNRRVFETLSGANDKIAGLMSKMQVDCIVKMVSQDQNVGYLITGSKLSGNSYANDDINILEIIADEVAIAVQNTLRYEEIAKFNITLQKKVDDATAQLKKTNEKLVELDEAKDEFISMASHQLRTPLTSVKGYISMVLDGDAGNVNDQQKTLLDQAYLSSQRMVYLIADLLNVSRLKTGKFVIDTKPTYLPDVIETEISQLTETAKDRGLEIIFNKPESFPLLNLDETKIRQVIMNFADNAIYYTPRDGRIDIALKADKNTVDFTVTDTGIGVPKSEQHHLFTKFYRAGNARKARPDGTGLGLFMAKKVVIASGGSIIFKTTPGKGSVFGFSFPRQKLELKK